MTKIPQPTPPQSCLDNQKGSPANLGLTTPPQSPNNMTPDTKMPERIYVSTSCGLNCWQQIKYQDSTEYLLTSSVERKLRAAETLHIILLAWSAEIQKYQSWKANQRAEGKVDITTNQICADYEKLSPLTDKALHEWNAANKE